MIGVQVSLRRIRFVGASLAMVFKLDSLFFYKLVARKGRAAELASPTRSRPNRSRVRFSCEVNIWMLEYKNSSRWHGPLEQEPRFGVFFTKQPVSFLLMKNG